MPKDESIFNNSLSSNHQKKIQQKNRIIQMLEQKNFTLEKQIQKIAKIMQENDKLVSQKTKQKIKKQKIIQITNDPEILNRQLKNCYKKIYLYECQVKKLKSKSFSLDTYQKVNQIEISLKQKKNIEDRLKQQLSILTRQITQNSKKLQGGSHQQQIEKDLKMKGDELTFLKEMFKQYNTKDEIKQKILKTQYAHIKNIEKEFLENGGSNHQLQNAKKKALSQFQQGRLISSKQNLQDNYQQRFSKANSKSLSNQKTTSVNPQNQTVEDRSRQDYESFQNQLMVLQKLNKKYEKQLEQSQKTIDDLEGKSQLMKNRLDKLEKQIQDFNSSIKLKKKCILAENMKPTHRKSLKHVSPMEDAFNLSEIKDIIPNKRKRNIINMTTITSPHEPRLYNN